MKKKKMNLFGYVVLMFVICFSFTAQAAGNHEHVWEITDEAITAAESRLMSPTGHYAECAVCGEKIAGCGFFVVSYSGRKMKLGTTTSIHNYLKRAKGTAVAWRSSDPSVISISKDGKVTAKKMGEAKIVILASFPTPNGEMSIGNIDITVQKGAVRTSSISAERKLILKKGKSQKLTVALEPFTSTEKITYKSSNKKVATVNKKGVVKAKKKG
ncbi:MAG: Ig-like domain-containing protein, partial [Eubacteriales bacterium]|nr:Ig-like domain-containing protein [Eubacteriales bacterium]